MADADQAPRFGTNFIVECLDQASLSDAIAWANSFEGPTTLYIYDGRDLPEGEDGENAEGSAT